MKVGDLKIFLENIDDNVEIKTQEYDREEMQDFVLPIKMIKNVINFNDDGTVEESIIVSSDREE